MAYSHQVTPTIENSISSLKYNIITISTCIRHAHDPSLHHTNKMTLIHIVKQQLGQKVNNNRPGDCLKNIYALLNLRTPLHLYSIHIFQCMGRIFCVEFQKETLKFYSNTVWCHYKTVQYNMKLHTSLQWLNQNINKTLNPQKDTSYLALTGKIWDVFCQDFRENLTPL